MNAKSLGIAAAMLPLFASDALAASVADIGRIQVVFNIVILVAAIASLFVAIRLLGLVKGGALAKGWQLWVISFFTLAFAQVVILAEKLDLFALSFDIAGFFYLVTVVLWFLGLLQTRRILG